MKKFSIILGIILSVSIAYSQNIIDPPPLDSVHNNNTIIERNFNKFIKGWNWGSPGAALDSSLGINFYHSMHPYYNTDYGHGMKITAVVDSGRNHEIIFNGQGIHLEPTVTVDETPNFKPRYGDRTGSVFGFKYRNLTIGDTTSDFNRYVLRTNNFTEPVTVLKEIWDGKMLRWLDYDGNDHGLKDIGRTNHSIDSIDRLIYQHLNYAPANSGIVFDMHNMQHKKIRTSNGEVMNKLVIILLLIVTPNLVYSQGSAGSKAMYETRNIVDMPTAGVLPRGAMSAYALFFTQGGVMVFLDAAPFENFNFGLSFSGINVLGEGPIEFQKLPGINIKWRLIDETLVTPAILIGFTNQGRGRYYKSYERFQTLFPGVYGAVSKNFRWFLGSFSLHGGVNYSWEQPSGQYYPNVYAGFEHSLGANGAVQVELNPNFADTDGKIMVSNSLLNAALRWSITKGLTLELIFRDLMNNTKNVSGYERWIGIEYINSF